MKQANKWFMRVAAILLAIGVAPLATAAELCVSNTSELNGALITAQFGATTIKIVQGTYSLSGSVWHNADVAAVVIRGGSSLRGGYTANCTGRDIAAENTVITDSTTSSDRVGLVGDLTIEGISWHTRLSLETDLSGPDIAPNSEIVLHRDVFEGAQNGGIGVFHSQNESVKLRVTDTLIHDSHGAGYAINCALDAYVLDGTLDVEFINNTVVSNSANDGGACLTIGSGGSLQGSGSLSAYNNIFYGNSGPDLFSNSNTLVLVDNVIGSHSYPTPLFPPIGTLTGDPQLDANYRPIEPGSPAINSGTEDVSGGLPTTDLDGRARVIGGAPDRGAYESNINNALIQTVTNTNDSGSGSLREAMINANAASGFNIIVFDIGSSCGPHVITLDSPLPSITSSVLINGYTQTGSTENDLDVGDDAVICVVLDSGDSASTGLRIGSSTSSSVHLDVRGLAFSGFSYAALDLKGGSEHVVSGNHFGGSVGGVNLTANNVNIWIGTGVSGATIGGDDVSQRNIVSGALGDGIHLAIPSDPQLGANHNQIINNYIGTTHTGNAAFANGNGVYIAGDHNTVQHNLISGNSIDGIRMDGTGAHNNLIDTNDIGNTAFGNGSMGVRIENAARDNTIVSNTIINNAQKGVRIVAGVHNRISRNAIILNGLLGIDLAADGVTANDDDSAIQPIDYANGGLNFPLLTQATGIASSGIVGGTLTTVPGTYSVELFVSGDCDASGHGEGVLWRKTFPLTISNSPFGGQGTATFTTKITPGLEVTLLDKFITATTSSSAGDTSEFSACMPYADDTIFANSFEVTP